MTNEAALPRLKSAEPLEHLARGDARREVRAERVGVVKIGIGNGPGTTREDTPARAEYRDPVGARQSPGLVTTDDHLDVGRFHSRGDSYRVARHEPDDLGQGVREVLAAAEQRDLRVERDPRHRDLDLGNDAELAGQQVREHPKRVLSGDGAGHGVARRDPDPSSPTGAGESADRPQVPVAEVVYVQIVHRRVSTRRAITSGVDHHARRRDLGREQVPVIVLELVDAYTVRPHAAPQAVGREDDGKSAATRPEADDYLQATARGGLQGIPIIGGAAAELLSLAVTPALEQRRNARMRRVGEGLQQLETAGFLRTDELTANEAFVSAATQASLAALRIHQREKLEALRNAVLSSALPGAPDDALQLMFITFVDGFNEWHLRFLRVLEHPKKWFKDNEKEKPDLSRGGGHNTFFEAAYEQLKGRRPFADQILKDLQDRGLVSTPAMDAMISDMTQSQGWSSYWPLSELGKQFLRFIIEPGTDLDGGQSAM